MTQPAAGTQFPCPECGAPALQFDPAIQALRCPYCSYAAPAGSGAAGEGAAVHEHALEEGAAAAAAATATGYGTDVRVVSCQTCGATVTFGGTTIAQRCDFCSSQHVLEQDAHRNVIRPESLVPFSVDQATAQSKFRAWLGSSWFRPGDLTSRASVEELAGVYIPFWTFDASVHSRWRAEAGHHYYEQEVVVENGQKRHRNVRKTRWVPARGERRDRYDDVLVVASRGLPEKLADRLATFDTRQLRPYDPSYLAGWRAEEYAVGLDDAWTKAAAKIERQQQANCARDVPGDTHRHLQVHNTFSDKTFKHILLPLWISSYRYGDKVYRCLVNGQTGEVSGEAPLSWVRVAIAVAVVVAVLAGLIALLTR